MKPRNLSIPELKEAARALRRDVIIMTNVAKSGHAGGPLSMADYLTALFFNVMRIDPANREWPERDRFVLSNGHCSAANYAVLARRGFFDPEILLTFRQSGSGLQGHPNRLYVPGLEASTGSLGHGISIAHGMALGARLSGFEETRIYANAGDGELQEGSTWEAIMAAGHYKSDNFCLSVDVNGAQIDGFTKDVMTVEPLDDKFRAFHWHVRLANGHDMAEILDAYDEAKRTKGKPTVLLFQTIMMKGCPSFENDPGWHGRPLDDKHLAIALKELGYDETVEEAIASYRKKGVPA